MKTRAQIYSHEASGILRDIFTYGVLHRNRFWVYIHRRMSNALCAMNTMDLQRYPENYELLSTDAALRAEQIACRMRHLVYGFTTVQKHEYLASRSLRIRGWWRSRCRVCFLPVALAALFYAGGYLAQFIYSAAYRMSMFSGMTRAAIM